MHFHVQSIRLFCELLHLNGHPNKNRAEKVHQWRYLVCKCLVFSPESLRGPFLNRSKQASYMQGLRGWSGHAMSQLCENGVNILESSSKEDCLPSLLEEGPLHHKQSRVLNF